MGISISKKDPGVMIPENSQLYMDNLQSDPVSMCLCNEKEKKELYSKRRYCLVL